MMQQPTDQTGGIKKAIPRQYLDIAQRYCPGCRAI